MIILIFMIISIALGFITIMSVLFAAIEEMTKDEDE